MNDDDQFSGKTILVVEDEISFAEHMEKLLTTLGYRKVFVVTNLEDAADIAYNEVLDVALLDVNLCDGLQTVGLGRSLAKQGVRVLFMSGFNAEEMARATMGFEFVEKPLSLSRLKAALLRAFVRSPNVEKPSVDASHIA